MGNFAENLNLGNRVRPPPEKQKIVVLPSSGISEKLGWFGRFVVFVCLFFLFLISFLSSTQKNKIWLLFSKNTQSEQIGILVLMARTWDFQVSAKNGSHFIRKWFLLNSYEEMCFWRRATNGCNKLNVEIFERALYTKSGSTPWIMPAFIFQDTCSNYGILKYFLPVFDSIREYKSTALFFILSRGVTCVWQQFKTMDIRATKKTTSSKIKCRLLPATE